MKVRSFILLLITAIVWGFGFVAQSEGMDYVGPFTFTCIRSILGAVVLIPFIMVRRNMRRKGKMQEGVSESSSKTGEETTDSKSAKGSWKRLLFAGCCCGVMLAVAQNLQQIGIHYTTVGKAGFITALYIILVPVFGLFLKKRVGLFVWIGVFFAVEGLYLLNMTGAGEGFLGFSVGVGEIMVFLCAAVFAVQIMLIDHFLPSVDEVEFAAVQFVVCSAVSGIVMCIFEQPEITRIMSAWLPILYAGAVSTGIGYTLQIIGQKGLAPTVSSLIMSLESVFAVVGGFLLLHERLTAIELIGCGLMMIAIVLAQLPQPSKKEK